MEVTNKNVHTSVRNCADFLETEKLVRTDFVKGGQKHANWRSAAELRWPIIEKYKILVSFGCLVVSYSITKSSYASHFLPSAMNPKECLFHWLDYFIKRQFVIIFSKQRSHNFLFDIWLNCLQYFSNYFIRLIRMLQKIAWT